MSGDLKDCYLCRCLSPKCDLFYAGSPLETSCHKIPVESIQVKEKLLK